MGRKGQLGTAGKSGGLAAERRSRSPALRRTKAETLFETTLGSVAAVSAKMLIYSRLYDRQLCGEPEVISRVMKSRQNKELSPNTIIDEEVMLSPLDCIAKVGKRIPDSEVLPRMPRKRQHGAVWARRAIYVGSAAG